MYTPINERFQFQLCNGLKVRTVSDLWADKKYYVIMDTGLDTGTVHVAEYSMADLLGTEGMRALFDRVIELTVRQKQLSQPALGASDKEFLEWEIQTDGIESSIKRNNNLLRKIIIAQLTPTKYVNLVIGKKYVTADIEMRVINIAEEATILD